MHYKVGGKLKLALIAVSIFVSIYNTISTINNNETIWKLLIYAGPFIALIPIYYFSKKTIVFVVSFLIIAFITTFTADSLSDFSGAVLFIVAFIISNHDERFIVPILIMTTVGLSLRFLNTMDIVGNSQMLIIFLFVYYIYYSVIYESVKKRKLFHSAVIDKLADDEIEIIKIMGEGYSQKEAGSIMGISQSNANNIVKRIKKKTGYSSLNQIMFEYGAIYGNG